MTARDVLDALAEMKSAASECGYSYLMGVIAACEDLVEDRCAVELRDGSRCSDSAPREHVS